MILVTGGAGFIGSNFVRLWLSQRSESLVNLDKLTYAGNIDNLASFVDDSRHIFVRGSITDRPLIANLIETYRPRAIVNFAAESHVDRSISGPDEFINTNIFGTFCLLEASRAYWSSLDNNEKKQFRYLHVSTDEVFGSLGHDELPFTETSRYQPNSPYSATKAASDHLTRAWFHTFDLPVIITNCSNNYGPFQYPEKLIPLCIVNAIAGRPLPIYGDGQQIRDWLYVDDHCKAIQTVIDSGSIGETYNIGGNNEISNLDLVNKLCLLLDELKPRCDGKSYTSQITFVADRPGHDRRYAINAAKMASELDWKPSEDISTGLRKTVNWYLNNSTWLQNLQQKIAVK